MAHFLTIVNSGNLLKVEYLPQYSRSKHQVQISVLFLSKMLSSGLTSLGRMRLRRVDSWELSEGDSVSGGEVGGGLGALRTSWRKRHLSSQRGAKNGLEAPPFARGASPAPRWSTASLLGAPEVEGVGTVELGSNWVVRNYGFFFINFIYNESLRCL